MPNDFPYFTQLSLAPQHKRGVLDLRRCCNARPDDKLGLLPSRRRPGNLPAFSGDVPITARLGMPSSRPDCVRWRRLPCSPPTTCRGCRCALSGTDCLVTAGRSNTITCRPAYYSPEYCRSCPLGTLNRVLAFLNGTSSFAGHTRYHC